MTLAVNTTGLSFVLDHFIGELHNLIFDGICYRFYLSLALFVTRPIINHTVPFPKVSRPDGTLPISNPHKNEGRTKRSALGTSCSNVTNLASAAQSPLTNLCPDSMATAPQTPASNHAGSMKIASITPSSKAIPESIKGIAGILKGPAGYSRGGRRD